MIFNTRCQCEVFVTWNIPIHKIYVANGELWFQLSEIETSINRNIAEWIETLFMLMNFVKMDLISACRKLNWASKLPFGNLHADKFYQLKLTLKQKIGNKFFGVFLEHWFFSLGWVAKCGCFCCCCWMSSPHSKNPKIDIECVVFVFSHRKQCDVNVLSHVRLRNIFQYFFLCLCFSSISNL